VRPSTLAQAIDALAAVLALLVDWDAHNTSPERHEWILRGQEAVMSREPTAVRSCLANCCVMLDDLADAKTDQRTFDVVLAAHDALLAVQRDTQIPRMVS
jgi:hypothetical protein